ncbi:hypothetical protein CK203_068593 [Vitis vinifera]|uniref:Rhamnogalacturonan endolyase n=1 Tax=Vitis vinifera TaxID=29760 RepID=A0A438EER7_VITVI|nr:hypothetical protein CK203_068593 [Vitis vinifera]
MGGMDNLLDLKSSETNRGYWDINWSLPGGQDRYQLIKGDDYSVVHSSNESIEVSFRSTYDPSTSGIRLPLSIDLRYILRAGVSGFYCYAIYELPPGCRAFDVAQTRMVFKLRQERFHYMAISDEKQRVMPMPEDLLQNRGKKLIVPESVLLVNPINPHLKGEVDDNHEFRNGGPTKQNLTVHTGPACLAMFHGTHYIGEDIMAHFKDGETWRKVFAPSSGCWRRQHGRMILSHHPITLLLKNAVQFQGDCWSKTGLFSSSLVPAKYGYVGLSVATTEGSWQTESKGYQFWVQTDLNGNFTIKNVIPGAYGLHGWVPGFIGDYLDNARITVSSETTWQFDLCSIRDGPTVWEIGFPDRTTIGFYVPDVNPMYANKLFLNSPEKFRQYGLWDRYTDLNPKSDQVFTIGVSDPKKDWFFAHVDSSINLYALTRETTFYRRGEANKYLPTQWEIKFNLDSVTSGIYKLRLAMASATRADLKVHINDMDVKHLVFQVQNLGMDTQFVDMEFMDCTGFTALIFLRLCWLRGTTPYFSHRPGEEMQFVESSMIILG